MKKDITKVKGTTFDDGYELTFFTNLNMPILAGIINNELTSGFYVCLQ